jgi:hypothetical protein
MLKVVEAAQGAATSEERNVFEQRLTATQDLHSVEATLGQLVLWALDRAAGGLGFGNYPETFEKLCEENLAAFWKGTDLTSPEGQHELAVVMFAHGRRRGSWPEIEHAIGLFERAASNGHEEAKRFLREDLPVVRDRLESKFKGK